MIAVSVCCIMNVGSPFCWCHVQVFFVIFVTKHLGEASLLFEVIKQLFCSASSEREREFSPRRRYEGFCPIPSRGLCDVFFGMFKPPQKEWHIKPLCPLLVPLPPFSPSHSLSFLFHHFCPSFSLPLLSAWVQFTDLNLCAYLFVLF